MALEQRFTLRDDGDGLWSVFDEKGETAVVQGRTLSRLSEDDAYDAVNLLNMVAGIRNQQPKPTTAVDAGLHSFLLPIR